MSPPTPTILLELNALIDQIDDLATPPRRPTAHVRWVAQGQALLADLFGRDSPFCTMFDELTRRVPADEAACVERLDRVRGLLLAARDEAQARARKQESPPEATPPAWRPQVWWVPIVVALIGVVGGLLPVWLAREGAPARFVYTVHVRDRATGEVLPNARVTLEAAGVALESVTDSDGRARLVMDRALVGRPARLLVQGEGYAPYLRHVDLAPESLPADILLGPGP